MLDPWTTRPRQPDLPAMPHTLGAVNMSPSAIEWPADEP
jgi:hypothetical protein